MLLPTRIPLRNVMQQLGYKDIRSALRWCANHNVKVFSNEKGRGQFVLQTEFRLKYLETTITHLRRTYRDKWREALHAHLNDDLLGLVTVHQVTTEQVENQNNYQKSHPKTAIEEKFFKDIDEFLISSHK